MNEINQANKLPCRVLLYMDILGTKQMYTNFEKTLELKAIIERFSSYARTQKVNLEKAPARRYGLEQLEPEISNFSDHILISYPLVYDGQDISAHIPRSIVGMASNLHRMVLEHGMLIRGAITIDELWHEGNSVLGKALNDAVKLEKKTAIYPRVILSESAISHFKTCPDPLNIIRSDFDGVPFIDYLRDVNFNHVINIHNELIQELELIPELKEIRSMLSKKLDSSEIKKDIHILTKWRWLAIKFNEYLDFCHQRYQTITDDNFESVQKFNFSDLTKIN